MLAPSPAFRPGFLVILRLALRSLRGGLSGFRVFLACIALGVAAIVGVGSLALSLRDGLGAQGRLILGGDVSLSRIHRAAEPAELAFMQARGRVTSVATMRAMSLAPNGRAGLVEIKAVDGAYPTVGQVEFDPPGMPADALAVRGGVFGAAVDPALFARLEVAPGTRIRVGEAEFELRAALKSEPDKLAGGVTFGPRLMISQEALAATGLLQPGSIVRWTYRISLPEGAATDEDLARFEREVSASLPESGFETRSRVNAAPGFTRNLERFTQFLVIVGLTALVVGGVGVANAVTAYVDRRRKTLAVYKSLGASGGRVFAVALTEVGLIGALGTLIGLVFGSALPFVAAWLAKPIIPLPLEPHLHPAQWALGAAYGLMAVLAFSMWPLGRAHDVPVSALFRDEVAPSHRRPRAIYIVGTALAVLGLAGTAILFSYDRRIAISAVVGTAAVFILLRGVAWAVAAVARRLPRFGRTELRLAVANIHRPGALTPSLVLSLGLGVTLLVTIALIDANIRNQLSRSLPDRAPTFFFVDIAAAEVESFETFLKEAAPGAKIERAPLMRGRILRLNDTRSDEVQATERTQWVLEGDRGITHSAKIPEGSVLAAGEWWGPDYAGPPLVSFDQEIASGIGLKLGDTVTVNVLGRTITARVANFRRIEWQSLGINFVMVFSPNTFAGAPFTSLATMTMPNGGSPESEARILSESAKRFPSVTAVRVKDALEAINDVVSKLAVAIRAASGLTVVASILVLAGALGAGHRARIYDAVILKALGATRGRLILAYILEYGILGLITGGFGLIAGFLTARVVVTQLMKFDFVWFAPAAFTAAGGAAAATILLGLVGTWRVLGQKPARHLRSL